MKSLLVVGGTGYLGRHICFKALSAGWKVTSLSRSGRIQHLNKGFPISALSQIEWKKADVFSPATYEADLPKYDAVIHSLGTVSSNPEYKSLVNSELSDVVWKLPSLAEKFLKGPNPMEKGGRAQQERDTVFNRLNRDSAFIVARAFAETVGEEGERKPFVYISAEDWAPLLLEQGYIRSKREAEDMISGEYNLRPVFLRPGFITNDYDSCTSIRSLASLAFRESSISIETVANAAVEAISDDSIEGVVSLKALQQFASKTKTQPAFN